MVRGLTRSHESSCRNCVGTVSLVVSSVRSRPAPALSRVRLPSRPGRLAAAGVRAAVRAVHRLRHHGGSADSRAEVTVAARCLNDCARNLRCRWNPRRRGDRLSSPCIPRHRRRPCAALSATCPWSTVPPPWAAASNWSAGIASNAMSMVRSFTGTARGNCVLTVTVASIFRFMPARAAHRHDVGSQLLGRAVIKTDPDPDVLVDDARVANSPSGRHVRSDQPTSRHGSPWQTDAVKQRRKASVGPKSIERRFNVEHRHLPVTRFKRPFEPLERSI